MQALFSKTIDLRSGDAELKRKEIRDYFLKTWETDEKLYSQLRDDDVFYKRGDSLRHIILFYLGHTAVFFINKLFLAKLIDSRIRPDFESIFAIGVDEMSWDDLDEKHYDWPTVPEVRIYRDDAKKLILNLIEQMPLHMPVDWNHPFWIIMMGIEHERIHLETSSVLIRQLPFEDVVPDKFGKICQDRGVAPTNKLISVKGGTVHLGKPENHPYYGWDNEYGKLTEEVADFEAGQMLVSNGEFLEFVEHEGYHKEEYWTEEGWNWCQFRQAEMPLFWRKELNGYKLRLVADEISMPWNWPVEVNYLEAKAYCNWRTAKEGKTYRLPTEAEWYKLLETVNLPDQPNWKRAPGNINLEHFSSPCPVNHFAMGEFYDLIGNVWQWTETPITGFPGFKVHPMYDDFSTPTFDGKHNLIKGGSWISTGNEATKHARYAFRRHFYQHAGLRVVCSENPIVVRDEMYETDQEVANSCENMWNDDKSNFSVQLASFIQKNIEGLDKMQVLDLNADTGRLAFELAPNVAGITAIDMSARFIRLPIHLKDRGFMRYIVKDEGELVFYREIVLEQKGLGSGMERISFLQDNPNNLKPVHSGFDLIVLPHVLEELSCPILFLKDIYKRLNPGGYLVIASDYDWDKFQIKPEHWPGGFKRDGEPVTSMDGIKSILSDQFEKILLPVNFDQIERISSRKKLIRKIEVSLWKLK